MVKALLISFVFLRLSGVSQDTELVLFADSKVEIKAVLQECERKDRGTHIQYYYIEVKNLLGSAIKVSFKKKVWYNGNCTSCDSDSQEYYFVDSVAASSVKQGDCYINTEKKYRVFSKMLNFESKSILTDFSITNVQIEKL